MSSKEDAMSEAKAIFSATAWEEKAYWEGAGGRKLTKVDAAFAYTGDIKGEGPYAFTLRYELT
jgi:Protein of unknown function (DUF3224)